mmetsp:Transcript_39336/g.113587  ORF Transcript_39336/g.113587 Transcript_39336/m.113587 type:complete len:237 (-) Transcript_39336:528-1238(-)
MQAASLPEALPLPARASKGQGAGHTKDAEAWREASPANLLPGRSFPKESAAVRCARSKRPAPSATTPAGARPTSEAASRSSAGRSSRRPDLQASAPHSGPSTQSPRPSVGGTGTRSRTTASRTPTWRQPQTRRATRGRGPRPRRNPTPRPLHPRAAPPPARRTEHATSCYRWTAALRERCPSQGTPSDSKSQVHSMRSCAVRGQYGPWGLPMPPMAAKGPASLSGRSGASRPSPRR